MGELGNFLYGQKVVRPILKQFFRCPFCTIKELHDVQVGAVHAGAVLQLIYGIAPSIEAKASLAPVICWEGKRRFFPCRFRLVFFLFFCFCRLLRRFLFFLCRQQCEAERADREPQVQLLPEPQQRAHAEKSDQKKDQQADPDHF